MFEEGQIGIYIHWPFCVSKCPYCDFNVYLDNKFDGKDWLKAYIKSVGTYKNLMPDREVVSIYFGGGTPSLMNPDDVESIINVIQKSWRIADNLEVTLEANPTSTEIQKFAAFKAAGVNRLSLGVQSLRDDVLEFLGRLHGSKDVMNAIHIAHDVFDRFTFDLIYALPDQTTGEWEKDLREAIPFMKGHLSAYQLTVKSGTAFEKQLLRGDLVLPDENKAAEFYNITNDIMAAHDMPAYEVSNYARRGQESRHNMIYWYYQDYIGIGPGAHGRIAVKNKKYAAQDWKKPSAWMGAVHENGHGAEPYQELSRQDQFEEMLMGGLRVSGGLDLKRLEKTTGLSPKYYLDWDKIRTLEQQGWLHHANDRLVPSREGWLRTDSILPYIIKA